MKTILKSLILLTVITIVSCGKNKKEDKFGNPTSNQKATAEAIEFPLAEKGKEIFEGKGTCVTCHKLDIKVVGPSIQDIAKIYKEKNASIATFLKGNEQPIIDSTQFEVMKANFAITKAMTNEERQSLEQYILSEGK
ncbi:c-type cytochrome [Flavobacterium sp.]|jgi:cytochrome c|uniref:c-type cytochrome n=1 Tax=Flavobacterium sp. TaxID=239 RepID=UPI0037BF26DC